MLAADVVHNSFYPTDVNDDGQTSPVDALYIINLLNDASSPRLAATPAGEPTPIFFDVNDDGGLSPFDVLLVLNTLNAEGEDGDLVRIRLAATNANGDQLSQIGVGESFQLRAFVQDLTARDKGGVFAGYLDVTYDAGLAEVTGLIQHGSAYGNAPSGSTATAGLIDEAGSIDGLTPLGPTERLLFTVPMRSKTAGQLTFTPDPADVSPLHDVLVFGVPVGETSSIVAPDRIDFISTSLQVGSIVVPVANNDTYDAVAGQPLVVSVANGVLKNDTVEGGAPLTAALVAGTANGTVELAADGSFTYTPVNGFVGTDTFTYTANASGQVSNAATVTITVTQTNRAPVAVNDAYTGDEDTTLNSTISVLANDTDADGDPLVALLVSGPSHGALTLLPNGQFTYVPAADYNGVDTFTYKANDGKVDSNVATVSLTIRAVNDGPIALPDSYRTIKGQTLTVAVASGVLANDSDPEGQPLTAQLVSGPANGSLDLKADGSFSYVPNGDFVGQDSFIYVASDGSATSANTTVTITVANEFQVKFRLGVTSLDGTAVTSLAPGAGFLLSAFVQDVSDIPRDGVFAAYLDVLYSANLVAVDGPITYGESYPNQQTGSTSLLGLIDEVGAFDGLKPLGEAERLVFTVPMKAVAPGTAQFVGDAADDLPAHDVLLFNVGTPVPTSEISYGETTLLIVAGDPPTAVDDAYATDEDAELNVTVANGVLANDTDPNGKPLTAELVTGPSSGNLVLRPDGSFDFLPAANFTGNVAFTYRATNGTQSSAPATVTITVRPVDDAPIAVNDSYVIQTTGTLVVNAANGVLVNDLDREGNILTAILESGPTQGGTLDFRADGSFTYTPVAGFVGVDTFTYRASANGLTSNVATVSIAVGDLNPSIVRGFVYADTDNDGDLDAVERGYGNVRITLAGTDFLGRPVSLETRTAKDGSYEFTGLVQGVYTLTEFQPMHVIDGKDTFNGELSLRNDRFEIDLRPGVTSQYYNFGERGLQSQFIRDPMFFSSRTAHGMLASLNAEGELDWYCLDQGWNDYESVDVQLSNDAKTAEVTVRGGAGATDASMVSLIGNRDVRLAGDRVNGYMLRLNGDPGKYGLDAAAVDDVFSDV